MSGNVSVLDYCPICADSGPTARESRALDCNHVFCVPCLERLVKRHQISCPLCRRYTVIPRGLKVMHLRSKVIPGHKVKVKVKTKVKVVTSWRVAGEVGSLRYDEGSGTVLVSDMEGLRMYGLTGQYHGTLRADRSLAMASLAVDTRRGLILAGDTSTRPAVVRLDREGRSVGHLRSSHFSHIGALSYHSGIDVYVIADTGNRIMYYLDPKSGNIVRSIPAPAPGELMAGINIGCHGDSHVWVTSDWGTGNVRMWNNDGACVRAWTETGTGFGQFERPADVCMTSSGRTLVTDTENNRFVWLTAPARPDLDLSTGSDSGIGSGGSFISPYSILTPEPTSPVPPSSGLVLPEEGTYPDVWSWLETVWPEPVPSYPRGPGLPGDWEKAGTTAGLGEPGGLGAPRGVVLTPDGLAVTACYTDKHGPFFISVLKGLDVPS